MPQILNKVFVQLHTTYHTHCLSVLSIGTKYYCPKLRAKQCLALACLVHSELGQSVSWWHERTKSRITV